MDTTLRQILTKSDQIHNYVCQYGIALNTSVLEEHINTLQADIKTIQSVAKRLADTSNIINQLVLISKKKISYINPYPDKYGHSVLKFNDNEQKEVIPQVSIPVETVPDIEYIPDSKLYYVEKYKQYAVNIAGITLKGNLGNILSYGEKATDTCDYGATCSKLSSGECCFYHPPEDYIKAKLPVKNVIRNFTPGSWVYSRDKNMKNHFCRHVGSKDTLLTDLKQFKSLIYKKEVATREEQIIHDLLIYLILVKKGYIEKYRKWYK